MGRFLILDNCISLKNSFDFRPDKNETNDFLYFYKGHQSIKFNY